MLQAQGVPTSAHTVAPVAPAIPDAFRLLGDIAALAGTHAEHVFTHVVPALLNCLNTPAHQLALAELTALGAKTPQAFRAVIAAGTTDDQRRRLGDALRAAAGQTVAANMAATVAAAPVAPAIQPKMDFSAFGK